MSYNGYGYKAPKPAGRETTAAEALSMYAKIQEILTYVEEVFPGLSGSQRSFKGVTERISSGLMKQLIAEKIDLASLGKLIVDEAAEAAEAAAVAEQLAGKPRTRKK